MSHTQRTIVVPSRTSAYSIIRTNCCVRRNSVAWKKPEELLDLQNKEIIPLIRKLNAFIENVRGDIKKKRISEADGRKLILKTIMLVSTLTTKI